MSACGGSSGSGPSKGARLRCSSGMARQGRGDRILTGAPGPGMGQELVPGAWPQTARAANAPSALTQGGPCSAAAWLCSSHLSFQWMPHLAFVDVE